MCIECSQPTNNPKFCSRSCSTRHNNRINPRKSRSRVCAFDECDTLILASRKFCRDHKFVSKFTTIGDIRGAASYQANAYARSLARKWARANLDVSCCTVCGYSNHVEICHIHPLSEFPPETLIADTYVDNLFVLCPNHHWEFDNGTLTTEEIPAPPAGFEPA